jgi:hypothetical protein
MRTSAMLCRQKATVTCAVVLTLVADPARLLMLNIGFQSSPLPTTSVTAAVPVVVAGSANRSVLPFLA